MRTHLNRILNFAVMALALCLCVSVFAQNPQATSVMNVSGTLWSGVDSDGDHYEYAFMEDGTFHYTSPSGFHVNATWRQDGDTIYMQTNNKYSEYQGHIIGTHIEGNAWNTNKRQWTWKADFLNKPASAANGGIPTIAGTTWSVTESNGNRREFKFLVNGHLAYTTQDGSVTQLPWTQKLDSINIWQDDDVIEYIGRMTGTHMEGTAKNNKGASWTWTAEQTATSQ